MNSMGGYFELELRKGNEYHPKAIALNTGRNALEMILKIKRYTKVYIPYYTCDVILEPFLKLKIAYEFYSIDTNFEPIFQYNSIKQNEGFLYTNYFGIKDSFITKLEMLCKNLIIDNSQAFFSKSLSNIPTFYSCRKFFGVPDGAYLYLDGIHQLDFPLDQSVERFKHLLKRIEVGAEAGYNDYKASENSLMGQPIMQMSKLTKALLCNIDYEFIKRKRTESFLYFHEELSKYNELDLELDGCTIPMVYPLLLKKPNIKQTLIENKIFVATYWTNVIEWSEKNSLEYKIASEIICLPIDQRHNITDISNIVRLLKTKIK